MFFNDDNLNDAAISLRLRQEDLTLAENLRTELNARVSAMLDRRQIRSKSEVLRRAISIGCKQLEQEFILLDVKEQGPGHALRRWRERRGHNSVYFDEQREDGSGSRGTEMWKSWEDGSAVPDESMRGVLESFTGIPASAWE